MENLKIEEKKTVVHCPTEELANKVLAIADSLGYRWYSKESLKDNNYWDCYKENTCYKLNGVSYQSKAYFKNRNYKIISAEEFIKLHNMETKEFKVSIPEGYEIDKENSTFECIKFKKKILSYEDIQKALFSEGYYYINSVGGISHIENPESTILDKGNAASREQCEKLLAMNMLLNVAYYFNKDWEPDWNDNTQKKYTIALIEDKVLDVNYYFDTCYGPIAFKTKEGAEEAIRILGNETIIKALA